MLVMTQAPQDKVNWRKSAVDAHGSQFSIIKQEMWTFQNKQQFIVKMWGNNTLLVFVQIFLNKLFLLRDVSAPWWCYVMVV